MLKKFVFVLLAMFAFQLCWAVVSAYCMHETDAKAQHFGHHAHQHAINATKLGELAGENPDIKLCAKHDSKFNEIHGDDQANGHADSHANTHTNAHPEHEADSDGKNASFHADCGSCAHNPFGHCAGNYLHHQASLVSYQLLATSPAPIAPYLAQPERPKWQASA